VLSKLTENICLRLCSDGAGTHNMLKCRINLGVTGLRPPPGGAHAAQIVMSYKQQFTHSFFHSLRGVQSVDKWKHDAS